MLCFLGSHIPNFSCKKGIRNGIAERIMGHAEGNDIKDIYTHLHDEDIVQEMKDKWVAE
ncbi:hypothetical protein [Dysgonomonas sp. GY617]|uniref:hypothetical protein n=1 Tax=Dysgonomonas sp. GY617 TaxID=2780420 RepID=UPI0018846167|nr:hypothetical protein [Dysgonomonas sp. GY617]MBF0577568.1 hypothetical protein [Dysgonomonas sp. GY617]